MPRRMRHDRIISAMGRLNSMLVWKGSDIVLQGVCIIVGAAARAAASPLEAAGTRERRVQKVRD
jgi:hypothetical protein